MQEDKKHEEKTNSEKPKSKENNIEGIAEKINSEGQLEISVHVFEEEYEKKYNGEYIIDRPRTKYSEIISKIMQGMQATESWSKIASKIAKSRNIPPTKVTELIQNDGLTEEEEEMFNNAVSSGADISKLYSFTPDLLKEVLISGPVSVETQDDVDDLPLGLGNTLFLKAYIFMVEKFSLKKERKKK